ncbi:hypothetical protein [Streptomyces osmaniensis]|uniref:Secreted protein n=1 Tax=Streptomyces osmaniensis TaxID=593134 RepID=A0ABP6YWB9_9ACTN|nr:hypothetical protein KJK32_46865 [Streptomyces sp. JCM17656]
MPDFLSEPQRWVIPAVLIVSVAGVVANLWWERRHPSSYTRRPDVLAEWRGLSTAEQEEVDNASLDLAEQAEIDARQDAAEAAENLLNRARINVLHHP